MELCTRADLKYNHVVDIGSAQRAVALGHERFLREITTTAELRRRNIGRRTAREQRRLTFGGS